MHPSTLYHSEAFQREAITTLRGADVMALRIVIMLGSTRHNRQGEAVAHWIAGRAHRRSDAGFELVDLRDWPLPFLDSPVPPALGQYDAATQPWADLADAADGFVFVAPEYNHG
jgi:NAD(P)H-dependent FMN reductase